MTIDEICKTFQSPESAVKAWIGEGMPAGSNVSKVQVAGWLYQNGYIDSFKMTVTSMADVARFFGKSLDTIRKSWLTSGMPHDKSGGSRHRKYHLHEIAEWKHARDKDPKRNGSAPSDDEWRIKKREAEARIKIAEAETKELKVRRDRGEIVYRSEIEPAIAEALSGAKLLFRRIPEEMMPFFPKDQRTSLSQELTRQLEAVLHRYADWLIQGVEQSLEGSEDETVAGNPP